jgi:hypothetical protein
MTTIQVIAVWTLKAIIEILARLIVSPRQVALASIEEGKF